MQDKKIPFFSTLRNKKWNSSHWQLVNVQWRTEVPTRVKSLHGHGSNRPDGEANFLSFKPSRIYFSCKYSNFAHFSHTDKDI